MDSQAIADKLKELKSKKETLLKEKAVLESKLEQSKEVKDGLEEKIVKNFGTTDIDELSAIAEKLETEVAELLKKIEDNKE